MYYDNVYHIFRAHLFYKRNRFSKKKCSLTPFLEININIVNSNNSIYTIYLNIHIYIYIYHHNITLIMTFHLNIYYIPVSISYKKILSVLLVLLLWVYRLSRIRQNNNMLYDFLCVISIGQCTIASTARNITVGDVYNR